MRRFKYKEIVGWIIVVAIFGFLGKMVWDNWNQVKNASFTFEPYSLLLSTFLFAFSYFIQIWAWYLITVKLGIGVSASYTVESWFYSQLGKYLPGKVWLLLSRFYFYESKGKSKKAISIALYFEMATAIAAAYVIFLVAFMFHHEKWSLSFWRQSGLFFPLLLLGLVLLHPRVLQNVLNWFLKQLKKERLSLSLSYLDVLWVLCVCIFSWLVGGVGFYFFVRSIYAVLPEHILFLTGALAISSTIGLIALFAPSGLGVREGTLVYLLSFIMSAPVAVIISVLTRIWMTLIEIGLIAMVYLVGQVQKRKGKKEYGEA